MKLKTQFIFAVNLLAMSTLLGGTVQAATLAAQPLKCGGFVSLDSTETQMVLSVKKVGKSSCQSVDVQSLNVRGPLRSELTRIPVKNFSGVLVVIVNEEVVVLNTN